MALVTSHRYQDFDTNKWLGFVPPRGTVHNTKWAFYDAWRESLAGQVWSAGWRKSEIESIKKENERNLEIISPETAIREYPDSAKIIKKPVTRAEALYWAREQRDRRAIAQSFQGRYDGYMPQWMAFLGSQFTLPENWAIGALSYGTALAIPAARKAITVANLVNKSSKSRPAAAAFMAMDGAIGGSMYALAAKPLHSINEKKYGPWDAASEVLAGATFGAGLGGAFPKLTTAYKPLLGTRDTAEYMGQLMKLKRDMARYGSRHFMHFLQDNTGAINIEGVVNVLSGRKDKVNADFLDKLGEAYKKSVKEVEVDYEDVGGIRKRERISEYEDFSAFSSAIREGLIKMSDRFGDIGVGPNGIYKWKGRKFKSPRRFYKADMEANVLPLEKELAFGNLTFMEMYTPYTKGAISGLQSGSKFFGTTSPELAAGIKQISKQEKKVDIGKVRFREALFLYNLDNPKSLHNFRHTYSSLYPAQRRLFTPEMLDEITTAKDWSSLRDPLKYFIVKAMAKHKGFDGFGYRHMRPGEPSILEQPQYVIELSPTGVTKAKEFSSSFIEYDLKEEALDTKHIADMISGKHPNSVPPEVRNLMEEYYISRAVEDTNYFDSFVKRRSPYSEDIYQDGSAPMDMNHTDSMMPFRDTDIFIDAIPTPKAGVPMETGVPFSGAWRLRRMVSNIEDTRKKEGSDSERISSKVKKVRTVRDAFNAVGPEKYDELYQAMEQGGFIFPEAIPYNARGDKFFATQDGSILPWEQQGNMLQRVYAKDGRMPDWAKIKLPSRSLDLTIHPSVMVPEELQLSLGLVEEGRIPEINDLNRTTTFGDVVADLSLRLPALKAMGIWDVKYRTPKGDLLFHVGGKESIVAAGDLKKQFNRMATKLQQPVEGVVQKPNERAAEFKTLFSEFQGDDRSLFYTGLVRRMKGRVAGVDSVQALDDMHDLYESKLMAAAKLKAGSVTHVRMEGEIRQMESSFRRMASMVDTVANSDVRDPKTRLGQWFNKISHGHSEVLGVLGTTIDTPYWSMGGDNIDVMKKSIYRKYHTSLVRGLEEIGGTDIVHMAQTGVFDEDWLKIKHYKIKKRQESKGLSGKLAEQSEELEVSPLAWKTYRHLEQIMQGLQKELSDSGYFREPRFEYIGTRFYDLRTIIKTPVEQFADDVVKYTDMDRQQAYKLFADLRESHTIIYKDRNRPIGDVVDKFNHSQRLKFKDAESEIAFMKKYGGLKTTFSDSFISRSDPRGASSVFTGALMSIQRDATLMAVNSWLGSRPLLTLDLMFGALAKKAREGVEAGVEIQRAQDIGFRRSQKHAENMLDSLLFPARQSFARAAEFSRSMRAVHNVGKLATSIFRVFFSDLAGSVAALTSLQNPDAGVTPRSLLGGTMDTFKGRFKLISPTKRREVARRFNVLLSSDVRQYNGRFEGDPPGIASWAESVAMRVYGIPMATDAGKAGNSAIVGHWFSETFKLPWKNLNTHIQDRLRPFGMTEEIWDTVRQLPHIREEFDGLSMVTLDKLYTAIQKYGEEGNLTDKQINDIFRAYDSFTYHLAEERGVPQQGIYEASIFDVDRHDADSYLHNIGKLVVQYWGVGIAAARSILGSAATGTPGVRPEFRMQAAASTAAYLTFMSAVALQAKNVAQGKEFQNMDENFWWNAFATGGALGLMGDLLLSDFTGDQQGVRKFLLGPTLGGTAPNTLAVLRHMRTGEWEKGWGDLKRVFRDFLPKITPAQDFILNTIFLKQMGALSDFKSSAAAEKRRMKELGYDYIVN